MREAEKGFSLTELIVAMAMAVIVGMAGYVVFQTSNRSSVVQSNVSDAQQNARLAMDRLAQDIRSAGFGLPDPPFSLTIAGQTFTAPLAITNSATAPDSLTIVGGRFVGGTLNQSGDPTCNRAKTQNICLNPGDMPNFFSGAVFQANRKYVNLGGAQFYELATAGHAPGSGRLRLASATLDRDWPDGTQVFIVEAFTYARDIASPGCSAATPCLGLTDLTGLRGSGVVAENIEDVQFAYGIDSSPRDRLVDDTDADGAYTASDFVDAPAAPATAADVLAVRANVVSRTRSADASQVSFAPLCLEDRATDAACTGAANDGFRRRALTKVVTLRNPKSE